MPVHRSLSKLDPRMDSMAKLCHRAILIFCGDLTYCDPMSLGRTLLERVHTAEDEALVDEVSSCEQKQIVCVLSDKV